MSFFEEFLRCLAWRPLQALEALYWWVIGKRLRARGRLRRNVGQAPYAYQVWQNTVEKAQISSAVSSRDTGWVRNPRITVAVLETAGASPQDIASSLNSVLEQSYENFELILPESLTSLHSPDEAKVRFAICEESELNAALSAARGDYILFLRAGDQLSPHALLVFAQAIQQEPRPAVLYSDHDELYEGAERRNPWFKPQWDSEMFLAQDYLSASCLVGLELARSALAHQPAPSTPYALLLAATAVAQGPIVHVPYVACHIKQDTRDDDVMLRSQAVAHHVVSRGGSPYVGPFSTVRVRWPLPEILPLVSIIVPTRDNVGLLEACVSSLLRLTDYAEYEIVIVDNQSVEEETARYFADVTSREDTQNATVRVLSYDNEYNYSAINNFAAKHTRGEFLCLLNNDTEIFEEGWLSEMMRYAVRPEIGAVGAMLLYPDNTIQHAGVVLGMGQAAGHAHRFLPRSELGYFAQAHVPHFASAVTAACLVVEKSKFDAVGGLDDEGFNVAYNDVDLCLKLEQAGWRNVYAPQAALIHYESKSRGSDMSPLHIERYMRELSLLQERWGTRSIVDPAHHPHLDRSSETYQLWL